MHRPAIDRFLMVIDDIRSGAPPDLATLSVAMREARVLTAGSTSPDGVLQKGLSGPKLPAD
jgi:hypothetical protein